MKQLAKKIFNRGRAKHLKTSSKLSKLLSKTLKSKKYLFCLKILKSSLYLSLFIISCYFTLLIINTLTQFYSTEPNAKLGQQIYLTSTKDVPVERTIDIVMGADDGYIHHSAATMASILLNCDASSNFRFHILDGGISSDKKQKLLKLKKLREFNIHFYDMTKYDWSIFPDNRNHTTLATYYRLCIPEILSENIHKALYLDGDMIIEQDLKELWDTDISNYMLGAVEDEHGIDSRDRLGLSNKYFNAGVLLLNMNKLRETNLLEDSLSYLEKNKEKITCQDQDILNGLFNKQYKDLPLKWNVNRSIYTPNNSKHTYSDHDSKIAKQNPGIIHFTGDKLLKPWNQEMLHPLSSEYWNYYKHTDFYSPDQRKSPYLQLILMHVSLIKQIFNIILQ